MRYPRPHDRTTVRVQAFGLPVLRTRAALQGALDALVAFNVAWISTVKPNFPSLYRSGVVYRREWPREVWDTAPCVLAKGHGDCEDLAAWRAAELRVREGIPARAIPLKTRQGWHIVVQVGPGRIEDPSRRLGM